METAHKLFVFFLTLLVPSLTIWPGFSTAILNYESAVMLCTDVTHKVLRSETVLDFLTSLRQKYTGSQFTEMCEKELIGLIVLTK